MALQDTSSTVVNFIEETVENTIPASAFQNLRFTSFGIERNAQSVSSQEIRNDYQKPDVAVTGYEGGGSFGFELSYSTYDDFLRWLLRGTWSTAQAVTGSTISFTAPATIADSNNGFGVFAVGDIIRVSGDTNNAGNNGIFVVTAAAAGSLTVSGPTLTTQTAGDSISVEHDGQLKNGTTLKTFTIEKGFPNLSTPVYHAFSGSKATSMSLDMAESGIVTGSFDVLSRSFQSGSASFSTGAATAATTTQVYTTPNHFTHTGAFFIPGLASQPRVISLGLTVGGNARPQKDAQNKDPIGVGLGTFDVTGELELWFEDNTFFTRLDNETLSEIVYGFGDSAGNYLVFRLPSARLTQASVPIEGINGDVMATYTLEAFRDATEGHTIQVGRIAA